MSTRTHWVIHCCSLILLAGMGIFLAFSERTRPVSDTSPSDTPPLVNKEPDEQTTKRITKLIDMLASRNPAPKIFDENSKQIQANPEGESTHAVFDKSYNRALQVPVYLAMQQLLTEGEPALDLLVKHKDDKRYCLSVEYMAEVDENVTVGFICSRIFWAHIFPLRDELHFMTKAQYGVYPAGYHSGDELWKGKKRSGLAKVQIEVIDAMLEFVEKADAKNSVAWHPEAKKISPAEFEKHRKANIRILKAVRETILSTGKPYRPKTCLTWDVEVIGLPW